MSDKLYYMDFLQSKMRTSFWAILGSLAVGGYFAYKFYKKYKVFSELKKKQNQSDKLEQENL